LISTLQLNEMPRHSKKYDLNRKMENATMHIDVDQDAINYCK